MTVNWYGGGTRRVGTVGRTGHWYKAGEGREFEKLPRSVRELLFASLAPAA
jgi:hypothetical protein